MHATLGERIKEAMAVRAKGVSQNEVERRAGLNPGQLSMLIQNKRKRPNMDQVRRVADTLGVSFEWLATGEGEMLFWRLDDNVDQERFQAEMQRLSGPEMRPNCLIAAQLARAAGYDERAVKRIEEMRITWREDLPVLEWAWLMKSYNDVIALVMHREEEIEQKRDWIDAESMYPNYRRDD